MTISISYNYINIYYATHKPLAILHHLKIPFPHNCFFLPFCITAWSHTWSRPWFLCLGDFLSYRIGHLPGVHLDSFVGGDFLSYRISHIPGVDLDSFVGGDFLSYRIGHLPGVDLDSLVGGDFLSYRGNQTVHLNFSLQKNPQSYKTKGRKAW